MVDSAAVDLHDVCNVSAYVFSDNTPVVSLQCTPWQFTWSHYKPNVFHSRGFVLAVTFDGYAHGTATLTYICIGCGGCQVGQDIEVTPLDPGQQPVPVFSCDYLGGGTIEYRVTNAGTGVPFSVEATPLGPISMITQPMGLTGPTDVGSFIVSCTGAGPCGVTLTCRVAGGQIVNQCGVCFDCPSSGGMLIERPCSTSGVPVPAASGPMIGALCVLLVGGGLIALRRRFRA